jgi:DNA replication initiation complex subunit (GINS family)
MNTKLLDSLAQIIESLTPEEQSLLQERINLIKESQKAQINSTERTFYETATPEERAKAFREWVESHRGLNFPHLSDEDISRESIYGERG